MFWRMTALSASSPVSCLKKFYDNLLLNLKASCYYYYLFLDGFLSRGFVWLIWELGFDIHYWGRCDFRECIGLSVGSGILKLWCFSFQVIYVVCFLYLLRALLKRLHKVELVNCLVHIS